MPNSISEYEKSAFGREILAEVLTWIQDNLEPEQVFDEGELVSWADRSDLQPEDLFSADELAIWAEGNGWRHDG